MSTQIVVTRSEQASRPPVHASFLGIMRGEFLKITRLFWSMLLLLSAGFVVAFWLGAISDSVKDLQNTPLRFLYYSLEGNLVVVRILGGIFLLVLTSFTIGREYQYGTIRILLARGAGRVQLLLAKLAMLFLVALAMLAFFVVFIVLLTCIQMFVLVGNLNGLNALTSAFWSNSWIDLLTVMISMGVTILLAAAMNVLGRSLTFGLSASLIWFPIDNIGSLLMNALARVTHNNFWFNVTTYLLGPLLNRLPTMLLPAAVRTGFESFGAGPLSSVSGSHALWVITAYALVFFVVALVSTWKRDVKE
ncbi:ABC transporter permease [Ktedonobacteria bacterium brp13]|nr:ABC transporter permease [Ktedonobacteria bacterium brp13]